MQEEQSIEPPARTQEQLPTPSLAETIEQQQGELTLKEVRQFLEKGIRKLPPIENGGKLHGSSETENKKYNRLDYLKTNLGIEPDKIPHPLTEGKFLPERLVADVLIDTIALCHTVNALFEERERLMSLDDSEKDLKAIEQLNASIQLQIDIHNTEMQLRLLKGQALDQEIQFQGRTTNIREIGQQQGYFPARSLNPMREGYAENIYQALETALMQKQKPNPEPTSPSG